MNIRLSEEKSLDRGQVLNLYKQNKWSAADKPDQLMKSLENSHAVVSAWDGDKLVGLGNTLSDGHLAVYYSHMLVLPEYQGQGIGQMMMNKFQEKYAGFHQQILVADGKAIDFYAKFGFKRAGNTQSMWIYQGHDHD